MNSLTSSLRRSRISAALLLAILAAVGVQAVRAATGSSQQQHQHGVRDDVPGRRSLSPASERAERGSLDAQPAAPARRRQRLPHRRSSRPVRPDARVQDGGRRVGRPVQVGRRREELDQHAPARLPAGFGLFSGSESSKYSPMKAHEGATDPVVRAGTNGLFYFAGVAFDRGPSQPSAIFVARYMDLNNARPAIRSATSARTGSTGTLARDSSTRWPSPPTFRAAARPARSPASRSTREAGDGRRRARRPFPPATSTSPMPRSQVQERPSSR